MINLFGQMFVLIAIFQTFMLSLSLSLTHLLLLLSLLLRPPFLTWPSILAPVFSSLPPPLFFLVHPFATGCFVSAFSLIFSRFHRFIIIAVSIVVFFPLDFFYEPHLVIFCILLIKQPEYAMAFIILVNSIHNIYI